MGRLVGLPSGFATTLLFVVACNSSSTPSTASGLVTAVTIAGVIPTIGTSAQLVATATLSNGKTRSVTQDAVWESSDARIASVNSSGLVTGVGPGEVVISATYQSVAGHMGLKIPTRTYTLSGRITEAVAGAPLSGVYVFVVDSASYVYEAGTSENGTYSIADVHAGSLSITASKDGYRTTKTNAMFDSSNNQVDLVLAPGSDAVQ